MNVLAFLWQRITGKGCSASAAVATEMKRLRHATDLHLVETAAARRVYLDSIEMERATASALDDLVNTMADRK